MKRLVIALTVLLPFTALAQQEVDSISANLQEVVVTADSHLETPDKTILRPTRLEKKHSTNGYALLENMNLADFNVDASKQQVAVMSGGNVVLLINGVEAQPDELATLAASEIVQIEYQRNPGGKYVGNGAVINFLTVQYDFGGNLYLSAEQGVARPYGDYAGMVNYKRKSVTLSLTAGAKWSRQSQLGSAERQFMLNDGLLHQSIAPIEGSSHTNSQFLNFKFAHADENHSFDVALSMTRTASPRNLMIDDISYTGLYDFFSASTRSSKEWGLSPALKMHYNLYLAGGNMLMVNSTLRYTHADYRSLYSETGFNAISNNTIENSVLPSLTFGYFKTFASGLSLGTTIDEYYNRYHDVYSGSFNNRQTLTNNHAMAMLHVDHTLSCGLSYYLSAGITDLYSTIADVSDNQLSPMAFYGLTYNLNPKHSLAISGNYTHSIYNPSYKNNAVVQTSFFEATAGNPDLQQLKAYQNLISYSGRIRHVSLTLSYDFLKYFGNTSNRYYTFGNMMFHRLVNDGNFLYHKFILGLSAKLLDSRLRIKGNLFYSINRFESTYRPARGRHWRADMSASYMFGQWQVRGSFAFPYRVLGIEGINERKPAQYSLSLSWQNGNWAAECSVDNFLHRRCATISDADYLLFQSRSQSLSDLTGRSISLSLTYILPYGKKTDPDTLSTESTLNSAILRPF